MEGVPLAEFLAEGRGWHRIEVPMDAPGAEGAPGIALVGAEAASSAPGNPPAGGQQTVRGETDTTALREYCATAIRGRQQVGLVYPSSA